MKTGRREHILVKFDEEVEVSRDMYNHIKKITYKDKKVKKVLDKDGVPQNEWYDVQRTRFLVEVID